MWYGVDDCTIIMWLRRTLALRSGAVTSFWGNNTGKYDQHVINVDLGLGKCKKAFLPARHNNRVNQMTKICEDWVRLLIHFPTVYRLRRLLHQKLIRFHKTFLLKILRKINTSWELNITVFSRASDPPPLLHRLRYAPPPPSTKISLSLSLTV